jgi:hypothetical protein
MQRMKVLAIGLAVALLSGCAWVGRVGVATDGSQPKTGGVTLGSDVSTNGRYVVFTSTAPNLVAGDTNNAPDVFWRDNQTNVTERVSLTNTGAQANIGAYGALVSADGRYVAFTSDSTNLISGDTNDVTDVFIRDRGLGTTTRVSVVNGGGESDNASVLTSMTPDGRFVVFDSDSDILVGTADDNAVTDVFVRDRARSTTQRVSINTDSTQGDAASTGGSISDDGRYIAFVSDASTLDPGWNDSGAYTDVFVRDRTSNVTTRITGFPNGDEADGPSTGVAISGNGKVVAFDTAATNLVDPPDDANTDVYATVLGSNVFERVSVPTSVDAPGGGDSAVTSVSDDGRFVLFQSQAKNLVSDALTAASDAFVRDRTNHATVLAATTQAMKEPTAGSAVLSGSAANAISGDGRYVLFSSTATDVILSGGDKNGTDLDVFLWSNPVPFLVSATPATIARGTTTTVALHGVSLRGAGALAMFGDGVTVNSVAAVNETEIDVNVTVAANAAPGPRTPLILQVGTGVPGYTGGNVFLTDGVSVV